MPPEPSPLDATGIARRHFSTARKGYDPTEVRAFLHELSEIVGRLQRGESHELRPGGARRGSCPARRAAGRAPVGGVARRRDGPGPRGRPGGRRRHPGQGRGVGGPDGPGGAGRGAARSSSRPSAMAPTGRREIISEAEQLRHEAEAMVERRRAEGQDAGRRDAAVGRGRAGTRCWRRASRPGPRPRPTPNGCVTRPASRDGSWSVEAQAVRERMLGDLARRRRDGP